MNLQKIALLTFCCVSFLAQAVNQNKQPDDLFTVPQITLLVSTTSLVCGSLAQSGDIGSVAQAVLTEAARNSCGKRDPLKLSPSQSEKILGSTVRYPSPSEQLKIENTLKTIGYDPQLAQRILIASGKNSIHDLNYMYLGEERLHDESALAQTLAFHLTEQKYGTGRTILSFTGCLTPWFMVAINIMTDQQLDPFHAASHGLVTLVGFLQFFNSLLDKRPIEAMYDAENRLLDARRQKRKEHSLFPKP